MEPPAIFNSCMDMIGYNVEDTFTSPQIHF